ncbi:hypothetical protein [Nocardia fluminea]|uniref:hypothetical protein n=1 Tax=Nocardia fluminea TaxID=134984 RepID=UPI003D0DF989
MPIVTPSLFTVIADSEGITGETITLTPDQELIDQGTTQVVNVVATQDRVRLDIDEFTPGVADRGMAAYLSIADAHAVVRALRTAILAAEGENPNMRIDHHHRGRAVRLAATGELVGTVRAVTGRSIVVSGDNWEGARCYPHGVLELAPIVGGAE